MTLDEKIAQLFVLRVHGASADTSDQEAVQLNQAAYGVDNAERLVSEYQPGGVIYFRNAGNIRNPAQIAELSNGIQNAALNRSTSDPIPLLIGADQEGGKVARLSPPATWLPSARALATLGTEAAEEGATLFAREMHAMGIVQDYAPVADVNINPENPVIGDRAFSSKPDTVCEFVRAQIRGFQHGGVAAAVKHFPGHGDTTADTHTSQAVITHSRSQWREFDLPPFQAAIKADVDVVMTGHLIFPALDPSESIATTSYPIITDILRRELEFDGVVITDGLEMAAARVTYSDEETPLRALQAGADQLLLPPAGSFPAALKTIRRAVEDGDLSEDRIDQSIERILRLKQRYGLFDNPISDVGQVGQTVGSRHHLETARRLANSVA
ncbi:glycoside hydrolase family 3 protein [Phytoactinopolyspora endophytica]|uniref:glycoside hydrolase family 3 protein n=1 Tax=Phytoactinopolyspora endophytica TaxID=1642495 RepID=UPI0013EB6FBB|nr:glycoside hydrolase family 3 protein [Phytoactinopolyspora endophytica]